MAALSLAALSGVASAQIFDGVRISYNGSVRAQANRGHRLAPARLSVGATLGSVEGLPLPALSEISLALSPRIGIDTKGLPLCQPDRLTETSTAEALNACGDAVVGRGSLTRVLNTRENYFASTELLTAFNGRYNGQRAIFVHTESRGKIEVRKVFVLKIERTAGAKGYTLFGALPPVFYEGQGTDYGSRVSQFKLFFERSFAFKGKRSSYLSVTCPPEAADGEDFTIAHESLVFGDDLIPHTSAVRSECGLPSGVGS